MTVFGYGHTGYPRDVNMLPNYFPKANVHMVPRGNELFGNPNEYDNLGMLGFWIKRIEPDILITLADLWMTDFITNIDLGKTRWIRYLPFDSETITSTQLLSVEKTDIPLAMSKFGKEIIQEKLGLDIPYIPHGVNTDLFKPVSIEQRLEKRKKSKVLNPNDFVIIMVGRNQQRKMQPYLIKGFAKFSKGKNDVRLLCHFDFRGDIPEVRGTPPLGYDIVEFAKRYGFFLEKENRIIKTLDRDGFQYQMVKKEEDMPSLYHISDVHYCCGNEGFGIPPMEANACGVPNVIPNYTTARELTNDGECGLLVKTSNEPYIEKNSAEWVMPDTNDLADKFQLLYDNRKLLQHLGKQAREYSKNYDWRKIIPIWNKLVENVINTPRGVDYAKGGLGI